MEKTPILSVIIPAYNVEAYIRQAVESALRQSWDALEIIVVDDGSTDGTMEALHDIDDYRLHRVWQAHAGLAAARNSGIQAARGAYLGFLDGDDLWTQTKAERHFIFFRDHPEIDVTFSYAWIIDELGLEVAPFKSSTSGEISFQDLLIGCPHCNAILRRDVIERAGLFDIGLVGAEDLDMWLRIAMQRRGNIYCIPEFLAFYRRRADQLSGDWHREEKAWQQLFEKFIHLAPEEIRRSEEKAHQARYRYYAFLAYEKKRYGEAFCFLRTSLQYAPWNALVNGQTWSLIAASLSGTLLPESAHRFLKHGAAWWRCHFRKWDRWAD
jgi:glycosyltransferase involved in cell wall biosynthesis